MSGVDAPQGSTPLNHFREFGNAILDKLEMWSGVFDAETITFDRPEILDEVRNSKTGVCFIGSHLGNLELLRAFGETQENMVVNALVYTRHSPHFNRMLQEVNPAAQSRMIEVDAMGPATIIALQQRIARGEHVAIVADRTSVRHEKRSVQAEFLGAPASFPEGPFVLAYLLECPVYLIFCLRLGQQYKIFIEPFADPLELPRDEKMPALNRWISRYAQRLEHYCLMAPLQWFNFFDFWNEGADRNGG